MPRWLKKVEWNPLIEKVFEVRNVPSHRMGAMTTRRRRRVHCFFVANISLFKIPLLLNLLFSRIKHKEGWRGIFYYYKPCYPPPFFNVVYDHAILVNICLHRAQLEICQGRTKLHQKAWFTRQSATLAIFPFGCIFKCFKLFEVKKYSEVFTQIMELI